MCIMQGKEEEALSLLKLNIVYAMTTQERKVPTEVLLLLL